MAQLNNVNVSEFCNIPENTTINSKSLLDMLYPVGSTYIGCTSTNPSTYFGGTWKLINKQYKSFQNGSSEDGVYFTLNTSNASSCTTYIIRTGNCVRIRLGITTAVSTSDTAYKLGTIKFSEIGISTIAYGIGDLPGISDGGSAAGLFTIAWDTGSVEIRDVIADNAGTMASGNAIFLSFVLNLPPDRMLDDFCDRFYWQRTA